MTDGQRAQRLLPAVRRHEIGDDDHQRRSPDQPAGLRQGPAQVRGSARILRRPLHPGDQAQQRAAPRQRRDDGPDALVKQQGAHSIAACGQQLPNRGGELQPQLPLQTACRSPIQRAGDIDQHPGVEATVGQGLPDVWTVGAGRDVPFDGPRIVAGLVFAHVAVLDPNPAESRLLVASGMKAQPPEHRPPGAPHQLVDGDGAAERARRQPDPPDRYAAAGSGRARAGPPPQR